MSDSKASAIYPRCKADMFQVYVSAEALVIPCCWIGNEPHMREYRQLHSGYLQEFSIANRDIDEILEDPRYAKVEQSWDSNHPFNVCQRFCSTPLETKKQGKLQGRNRRMDIGFRYRRRGFFSRCFIYCE